MKVNLNTKQHRNKVGFITKSQDFTSTLDLENVPKHGKINTLEVEEVIFCLLDGLIDPSETTKDTITKSIFKFASLQPEFTLKSILSFLEVQNTSIAHQHSLLAIMKKCISQCQSVLPNTIIREILLFMLKELNFIKATDTRHVEMKEIVNAAAVLCPAFSVDLILAFIRDVRNRSGDYKDVLCIYIKILTHLCAIVPRNAYVRTMLISSHIMSLYNKSLFVDDNSELCKDLCTLLYTLTNMLIVNEYSDLNCSFDQSVDSNYSLLYKRLNLEDLAHVEYNKYYKMYMEFQDFKLNPLGCQIHDTNTLSNHMLLIPSDSPDEDLTRSLPQGNTLSYESNTYNFTLLPKLFNVDVVHTLRKYHSDRVMTNMDRPALKRKGTGNILKPAFDNLQAIFEPVFQLMMDSYLSDIYTNPSYNFACMEILYSLVILSQHVSDTIFEKYTVTLLDAIIVRFYNYLPNLKYKPLAIETYPNTWIKLHRSSSTTFTNKIATLFSSIDKGVMLPPTFFVRCLRLYLQFIMNKNPYVLYCQMNNICEVLFGLLHKLLESCGEYFILGEKMMCNTNMLEEDTLLFRNDLSDSFMDTSNKVECRIFIQHVIVACRILFSNASTSLVLLEFLYRGLRSGLETKVMVSLYLLTWIYSSRPLLCTLDWYKCKGDTNVLYCSNCSKISRLLYEIFVLLRHFNTNPISTRLILILTNHLSKGNWLTFHYIKGGNSSVMNELLNFTINLKVKYDISKRILENNKLDLKINTAFFNTMYQGTSIKDDNLPLALNICFDSYLKTYASEVMLRQLLNFIDSKRHALTIFKSLDDIITLQNLHLVERLVSRNTLMKLITYVLIYIHDPINYFGEAHYSAKLLPKLIKILFDRDIEVECKVYTDVDLYLLNEEFTKTGDNIMVHFEYISTIITQVLCDIEDVLMLISVLESIVTNLKNLEASNSSYNTFIKMGETSSSSFTIYHTMGMINVLACCSKFSLPLTTQLMDLLLGTPKVASHAEEKDDLMKIVSDVYGWNHLLLLSDSMNYTMVTLRRMLNRKELDVQDMLKSDDRLFYYIHETTSPIQEELISLRGLLLSILIMNSTHYKYLILKLYRGFLINVPKSSSFTIFGKSTSVLLSEKVKCIYIASIGFLYGKISFSAKSLKIGRCDFIYTKDILNMMSEDIKDDLAILERIDTVKLMDEYNEIESNEEALNEHTENTNLVIKCIVCPLLYLLNNENDPSIQLSTLRSMLIILSHDTQDECLQYLLLSSLRLLYFLSNPTAKDYGPKNVYELEKIENYYFKIFNREGTTVTLENFTNITNQNVINNISFASLLTLSALSKYQSPDVKRSLYPFSILYAILAYCDYYDSQDIYKLSLYYMNNLLNGQVDWMLLSKMLITAIYIADETYINNRIILALDILQSIKYEPTVLEELTNEQRIGWLYVILLLWAHLLRIKENNPLKLRLVTTVIHLLNLDNIHVSITTDSNNLIENYNRLNTIDKIDRYIPKNCLITSLVCCINLLEASTCISDSFAKIIHKILRRRYDEIDFNHLESTLDAIFKRFSNSFLTNTPPTFLRHFLIDLSRANFNVLCKGLFTKNHNITFQLSIVKLVTTDLYIAEMMLSFLSTLLLPHDLENDENYKINCPIDFILDFTTFIFQNKPFLAKTEIGCDFITALLIFISTNMDEKSILAEYFNVLEKIAKIVKTEPCASKELITTRDLLRLVLSIIGSNIIFMKSFIKNIKFNNFKVLDLFCLSLKFKLLSGCDCNIISTIMKLSKLGESMDYYYTKSLHYYLKWVVPKKRENKRILKMRFDLAMEGSVVLIELLNSNNHRTLYHVLRSISYIISRFKVREFQSLIYKFLPFDFVFNNRIKYAHLQVYISICNWLLVVYGNATFAPIQVKCYFIYPLALSMVSVNEKKMSVCRRVIDKIVPFLQDYKNIASDNSGILTSIVLSGKNSGNKCFCGCNALLDEGCYKLCINKSFQLLGFFSSILPQVSRVENLSIPHTIVEEFKMVKRDELDKRSHTILFGEERQDDTNDELTDEGLNDLTLFSKTSGSYFVGFPKKERKMGIHPRFVRQESLPSTALPPTPAYSLEVLNIIDHHKKANVITKMNLLSKSEEGVDFLNLSSANIKFYNISSVEEIINSTLFTSPTLYRFALFYKYLKNPPFKLDVDVNDKILENAIELMCALINIASIHLNSEENALKIQIKQLWPNCFLHVVRLNCILHLEALSAATSKQLCKLLNSSHESTKNTILKSMELFASVKSTISDTCI